MNDELNQIADTDYNGTIVLNGGVMSDGLNVGEMTNGIGEFNYKDKAANEAAAAAADKALIGTAADWCGNGDAAAAVLDNSKYSKADADVIWNKLGLTPKSTNVAEPDELQITFTYDGSAWKATGVLDKEGNKVDVAADKLAKLTTKAIDTNAAGGTGKGGFSIDGTTLNNIFDAHDVQKYDTATVKVQNILGKNFAPANAGVKEGTFKVDGVTAGTGVAPTTIEVSVKDTQMDATMKAILDGIKGNEITSSYEDGVIVGSAFNTNTVTVGETEWTLAISDAADGESTISASTGTGANKVEKTIGTITWGTDATADVEEEGDIKWAIDFDSYQFVDTSDLKAESIATPTANKPAAGMFEDAAKVNVSKSDAFENSTAIMTYAENITLQTGARTKDAVNFTFNYNRDGSADMGDLKANLNLSSRADGLNTENLSLASQDAANHAIDQIDKAINKTSMVRASFGAIQNRLEHKIDNLNTTTENLTEAESNIRDTDMAQTMMDYTKFNILQQAAQSMLAQANQQPQSILQLLG